MVLNLFFLVRLTEWELVYNEKYTLFPAEEQECKAALSKSLNDLLKEEEIPAVRYDYITVTHKTLEIRFVVGDLSYYPNIDALSTIVKRCFNKHKLRSLTVKKGRVASR